MTDERSYPARPFVGVGVVVFQADRVLLIQRGKPPRLGQWSLPGGVQEVGETVHEAARREVREEAGVEIDILGLIDVVDSIRHDNTGRVQFHYTLVDLAAEWRAGEATAGSDAMAARWTALAEIGGLGLWAETVRIVRQGEAMRGSPQRKLSR
ncbi:MAG: NUDIX domain-containing protein [Alphaproteobacteria bacterium]|nr:NUDIX domain-containing protein [Alphaproteobacteria bacterium]